MLNSASPSSTTPTIAEFSYSGTELDAVAEATNYYGWIIDSFGRAIGERIVEAGAGIGTVSDLVLRRASPREMLLIEPAGNNIPELHRRFDDDKRVRIHHGYLEDIGDTVAADTVIAVNVMEHVERDAEFLRAAHLTLASGGALLLLVPAMPAIYGSLDRAFDHYRRYTRSGLEQSLLAAGFETASLKADPRRGDRLTTYLFRFIGGLLLLLIIVPSYRMIAASDSDRIAADVIDAADLARTLLLLGTLMTLTIGCWRAG